jgi:hypothetical protein
MHILPPPSATSTFPARSKRSVSIRGWATRLISFRAKGLGPEGWTVRDGGFRADLLDGTFVVYGDYSIEVTRPGRGHGHGRRAPEPIIIHYESVDPIHNHPDGSGYFRCRLRSDSFDDFGGGLAQGMFADQTLSDGRVVSNIRNILTFPGLGLDAPVF